MLVITIELWPGGDRRRAQHLGTATIANDGTGDPRTGNYNAVLSKRGRPAQAWRHGRVEGFPRKRLGPYDLLLEALQNTVGPRR